MHEKVFVKFGKCTLRGGTGEEVHFQQVENGDKKVKTHALGSLLKMGRIGRQSIVKESAKSSVLFTYVYFFQD